MYSYCFTLYILPLCPHQLRYRVQFQGAYREQVSFSDCNAADSEHGYLEFPSYQDNRFTIKLVQRDCGIQAIPQLQSSTTQTQWYDNIVHIKRV